MILKRKYIEALRIGSEEYNNAIDDVLRLFDMAKEKARLVHTPTGLYFNGYGEKYFRSSREKNTLSPNSYRSFPPYKMSLEEAIEQLVKSNMKIINGKKYLYNILTSPGSLLHKTLEEIYTDYTYIPFSDFHIEKDFKERY